MNSDKQIKQNAITVDRLNQAIIFLEMQQRGQYNPIYELLLSYLRDIRDNSLPDYVRVKQ